MTGLVLLTMAQVSFGIWLAEQRRNADISQQDLADRVGVSKAYISTLEGDKPNSSTGKPIVPRIDKIDKIARALGASVVEARLAAGYVPDRLDSETENEIRKSRFGSIFQKLLTVSSQGQAEVEPFIDLLDRELDKRLPPPDAKKKYLKGGAG